MTLFDRRLLEMLADGDFHSGEELGKLLGVSRAAVWKQLQKIEAALAIKFEPIKGRGYRLKGGLDLLDPALIMQEIPKEQSCSLHLVQQVDSTNRLAAELARTESARGCVVLAEQQSAGKGRRGRQWVSPFARNIYCSIVWEFESGAAALEGLSLAVGVGVVRTLREAGISNAMLKWPNDVLHNNRKLAGILLEMTGEVSGRCQVVVGIGLNVAMASSPAAESIAQPWTDASTAAGRPLSRNKLAGRLIAHVLHLLNEFEVEGFAKFRDAWTTLDCTFGKPVAMHVGEQVVHGCAAGVDGSGAFMVDTSLGRQWFHGGEVTLRVQN